MWYESITADVPPRGLMVADRRLIDGIPLVYYFGQHLLNNILIMDLLGPSMEDLFDDCGRKFTLKTVVIVGKQMVRSIT